ncbi:hypothetical protein CCR75_004622 [Bremia lactucae]|uniref:ADP/ATP translocase n=1 Tax=Bremia lactucae TaxID=4779 RepID=A0A976IM27_BRELC|nr:hypothetical protein CCR75_004622 [Bremia lactucae]
MAADNAQCVSSLTVLEAFLLAAIAKAAATILTYPFIRAKVLLQAQKSDNAHANMYTSIVEVLQGIGELEGLRGYFKGCSAQLFNTVLKSALLVMTKEQ